jgi:hypothetical protein
MAHTSLSLIGNIEEWGNICDLRHRAIATLIILAFRVLLKRHISSIDAFEKLWSANNNTSIARPIIIQTNTTVITI